MTECKKDSRKSKRLDNAQSPAFVLNHMFKQQLGLSCGITFKSPKPTDERSAGVQDVMKRVDVRQGVAYIKPHVKLFKGDWYVVLGTRMITHSGAATPAKALTQFWVSPSVSRNSCHLMSDILKMPVRILGWQQWSDSWTRELKRQEVEDNWTVGKHSN